MIDTDKYEGHAEGEWIIYMNDTCDECQIIAPDYGTIAQTFYLDYDKQFLATTKLIADAPLLLQALIDEQAEVKRLRDELKFVIEMLEEKPSDMEWYECRNLITQQVVINLDN